MAKTDTTSNETKIENGDIVNLLSGLTEIGNLDIEDFKVNWNISKNLNKAKSLHKAYLKSANSISKKHIKVDDKGQFQIENNAYVFYSSQAADEYNTEMEKLNSEVVEQTFIKVKASDLEKIKGIKGTHMAMCSSIITDDVK